MENEEDSSVNVYLNGLGLGSIAASMYLIQKADFEPSNTHILKQMGAKDLVGGSCDASEMLVDELVEYGALMPLAACSGAQESDRVFSATHVITLRTACHVQRDFDLDLFTAGLLVGNLMHIDTLERPIQSLHAQSTRVDER